MNRIVEAARYAEYAHRGQMRSHGHDDHPYILHPMRVAGMVMVTEPIVSEETVMAAWLHDIIEQTTVTLGDICREFGPTVGSIVEILTPTLGTRVPRDVRMGVQRELIASASWEAKLIKLADRIDNLREMYDSNVSHDFLKLYRKESMQLRDALEGTHHEWEVELTRLAE